MTHRFLIEADTELDKAVAHYEQEQDGLGVRFLSAVEEAIARIVRSPAAWRKITNRARQYKVKQFPYGIVYEIANDEIIIIAVAHLHRRFGYWKKRM